MCLICFSSDPLSEEEKKGRYGGKLGPFGDYSNKFDIKLCEVPCAEPPCWCVSIGCWIPSLMFMRHRALNHVEPGSGWSNYQCCQGYFSCGPCCRAGNCCEDQCPCPCMCLEALICPGLAASATSIVIRQRYQLGLDEDDVKLIRFSNCLQCISCICNCVARITDNPRLDRFAKALDIFADCLFCCVQGCVTAQTYHEIELRENNSATGRAPTSNQMNR